MKIEFNNIKNNLRKEQINEFKNLIREDIKVKKFTIFQKVICSWITIMVLGILEIVGMILFFKNFYASPRRLSLYGLLLIVIPILIFVIIFWSKKRIVKNAAKNLDFLEIFKKWLKYYEISSENVFIDNRNFQKEIDENRLSPIEADIDKISPLYTFVDTNNIVNSFQIIKWHWTTSSVDTRGFSKETNNYLDQTYMFNYNFDKKWDKLDFKLSNDNWLIKVKKITKKETLENNEFNKKFSYSYNDPIKIRMAFTPYTQELFVNQYIYKNIVFQKSNKILTTTCESKKISKNFSPFSYDVSSLDINAEKIKNKIIEDLTSDFIYLMKFIGHTRLMINLFK